MATHVYRYRYKLNQAQLRSLVPNDPVVSDETDFFVDITVDSAAKEDLDEVMLVLHYVFFDTDPVLPIV